MGFFNGSNTHFYPNGGIAYYNDVKRRELEQRYRIGLKNDSWYHVFLAIGAMALIVLFFIIFG